MIERINSRFDLLDQYDRYGGRSKDTIKGDTIKGDTIVVGDDRRDVIDRRIRSKIKGDTIVVGDDRRGVIDRRIRSKEI
jgi:hypothetical protein